MQITGRWEARQKSLWDSLGYWLLSRRGKWIRWTVDLPWLNFLYSHLEHLPNMNDPNWYSGQWSDFPFSFVSESKQTDEQFYFSNISLPWLEQERNVFLLCVAMRDLCCMFTYKKVPKSSITLKCSWFILMIFCLPLSLFVLELRYIPALAVFSSPLNKVSMKDQSMVYNLSIPPRNLWV